MLPDSIILKTRVPNDGWRMKGPNYTKSLVFIEAQVSIVERPKLFKQVMHR